MFEGQTWWAHQSNCFQRIWVCIRCATSYMLCNFYILFFQVQSYFAWTYDRLVAKLKHSNEYTKRIILFVWRIHQNHYYLFAYSVSSLLPSNMFNYLAVLCWIILSMHALEQLIEIRLTNLTVVNTWSLWKQGNKEIKYSSLVALQRSRVFVHL